MLQSPLGVAHAVSIDQAVAQVNAAQQAVVLTVASCADGADDDVPRGRPFVDVELREHFPAASSSQDTYTLLKFYNLSKDLVKTVLRVRLLHTSWHSCAVTYCSMLLHLPA